MQIKTQGKVIGVSKQWWLKVNTKPSRLGALDGALFPHIIKVKYKVGESEYIKRKWISPYLQVPPISSDVTVVYDENNPKKAKIL